jgi:hypothetical protein
LGVEAQPFETLFALEQTWLRFCGHHLFEIRVLIKRILCMRIYSGARAIAEKERRE